VVRGVGGGSPIVRYELASMSLGGYHLRFRCHVKYIREDEALIHTGCGKINVAIEVEGSTSVPLRQGVGHDVVQEGRSDLVVSYLPRSSVTLPEWRDELPTGCKLEFTP
jgi:hypothetical protein